MILKTVTSRKFDFPTVVNNLFQIYRIGKSEPEYADSLKYVDADNNKVYFCMNGEIQLSESNKK